MQPGQLPERLSLGLAWEQRCRLDVMMAGFSAAKQRMEVNIAIAMSVTLVICVLLLLFS